MKKKLLIGIIAFSFIVSSFSQNLNVTLASRLSYAGQTLSNIGGWVDTADGKEYALVGAENGLSIVDVSNPAAPVEITQIPGPGSIWREVKTVGDYAYVTTEDGTIGLQIIELTNLPATNLAVTTWKPQIGSDVLETIHALHADNGKVYLYGSNVGGQGAIIADVTANPMVPAYLGSYDPRYVHDGFVRNDTLYAGHIKDGECAIVDCTNPAIPNLLATFETPTKFTHNTWLSEDSKTLFTTDENANSYLGAFNITDLLNISETDRIQTSPGSNSIVHNTHILQKNNLDYAVTSWYTEGFTIVDASRPHNLVQVGNYDTYTGSGTGFKGCWGVYPFLPSGTIVASDIDSGLFVFTPTYTRACYLEGIVTNCLGAPLSGVNVALQVVNPQSTSHFDVTDFAGRYAVGIAVQDTYMVVFSKIGFVSDTDTVVLSPGVVVLDTFQLCSYPIFSYGGQIFDIATLAGIPNAHVSISSLTAVWDTVTDLNGNFSIPDMFAGTYNITAGSWGYVTQCISSQSIIATSSAFSLGLDKGIYDDFFFDFGWTVSGNASDGIWVRGEPKGTFGQNQPYNPDLDVTNDCGAEAFVTGNTGSSSSDDDVDGGTTILTSPAFDLSGYANPYVHYSRWKRLSFSSSDSVIIKLSNGATTVTLENIFPSSTGQAQWVNKNYKISTYLLPTSNMTFSIQVSDLGQDNNNEGGLDKFFVVDSTNSAIYEMINMVDVVVYPNPFSTSTNIKINSLGVNSSDLLLKVYDLVGKELRTLYPDPGSLSFKFDRNSLSGGIYFYRIFDGKTIIATGKICAE